MTPDSASANFSGMAAEKSPQTTEGAAAAAAVAAARRDRSPNYPAIPFSEAEGYARTLWEKDKRHPMTKDVAAQHLSYSKSSGATIPLFAAMKRYGLLESAGTDLRITEDAQVIFLYPKDSPEHIAMRKRLAMLPSLFGEVLASFPGGELPSDATLQAKLRTVFKFASADAAETFITALKEAVAIAGQGTVADPVPGMDNNGATTKETPMTHPQDPAIKPTIAPAIGSPKAPAQAQLPAQLANTTQTRMWDLGGGAVMTVVLPPRGLSEKNVARLKKYVAALEMEARIAWEDEDDDAIFGALPET